MVKTTQVLTLSAIIAVGLLTFTAITATTTTIAAAQEQAITTPPPAAAPAVTFPTETETEAYFKTLGESFNLIEFGTAEAFEEVVVGTNIYLVWKDGENINMAITRDGGLNWSPAVKLNNVAATGEPVIGASETGQRVMIAWEQGNQIFASTSSDAGQKFMTYQLSQDIMKAYGPSVYAANDDVYTLWFQQNAPNAQPQLVGHRGW